MIYFNPLYHSQALEPFILTTFWKMTQITFAWYIDLPHGMDRIMRSDRSPLFRKTISPWYDSEAFCVVVILLMVVVSLFSLCGLWAAQDNLAYNSYLWVPVSLLLMCLYVIFSIAIRLARRFSRQEDPYRWPLGPGHLFFDIHCSHQLSATINDARSANDVQRTNVARSANDSP